MAHVTTALSNLDRTNTLTTEQFRRSVTPATGIAGTLIDGAEDSVRFQRNLSLFRLGGAILLLVARMPVPLLSHVLLYRLGTEAAQRARNVRLYRLGGTILLLVAKVALPLLFQMVINRLATQAAERASRTVQLTAREVKSERAPALQAAAPGTTEPR
jgi:hypothetical protein